MATEHRPKDQVRLEGLELEAPIGVYAHERGILQKLVIDLAIECDLERAARTDDLADAFDYDRLAAVAQQAATERHHALIETVAQKIATRLLAELGDRADRVFVRVAKPGAVPGAKTAAVELWRDRTRP
jgi:dihydroneopterin aldolase